MMTDEQYSDDFDNNNSTTGEKIGIHKFNENSRISKLEKSKLHTVTKNVGVRKAHRLLFIGDNSKTTLINRNDCRE